MPSIMDLENNQARIMSMLIDIIEYADQTNKITNNAINTIFTNVAGKNCLVRVALNNQQKVIGLNAYRYKDKLPRLLGNIIQLELP